MAIGEVGKVEEHQQFARYGSGCFMIWLDKVLDQYTINALAAKAAGDV